LVKVSLRLLVAGVVVTAERLLEQIHKDGAWSPAEENVVKKKMNYIRGKLYTFHAMETTPLTRAYFTPRKQQGEEKTIEVGCGEVPEGDEEIRMCCAWGRGNKTFGFKVVDGSPIDLAWRTTRTQVVTAGLKSEMNRQRHLLNTGRLSRKQLDTVLDGAHVAVLLGKTAELAIKSAFHRQLEAPNGD